MSNSLHYSKLDYILKPFLTLHYEHGFGYMLKTTFNVFRKLLGEVKYQQNAFLKFILNVIFGFFGGIACLIVMPVYLLIYILTALITFSIAAVIVMALAIFYGLFPFVIKGADITIPPAPERVKHHGHDVLLTPISWSASIFNGPGRRLQEFATRPVRKVYILNNEIYYTHILERIALSLATVISIILYAGIINGFMQLFANFFILIIIILSSTLWVLIELFLKLFTTKHEEEN